MAENNGLYSIQGSTLTDIADAIREKSGKTKQYIPSEMAPAILSLSSSGISGEDGVGIASIEQTTTSTEDGGTNVVTVTLTDGSSSTFEVKNGSKGSTGERGPQGPQGGTPPVWTLEGGITTPQNGSVTVSLYKDGELYPQSAYLKTYVSSAGAAWRAHGSSTGAFTSTKSWSYGGNAAGIAWRCHAYTDSTMTELLATCSVASGVVGPPGETGPQGPKGDPGDAAGVEIANNLTTNDATKVLSAAQGVVLADKWGGCWIDFTDENGNPTDIPYLHWIEEVTE